MSEFFFILEWYYRGGGSGLLSFALLFIMFGTFIFRPIHMFYKYVKTGILDDGNKPLVDNIDHLDNLAGWKKMGVDFVMTTDPSHLGYDFILSIFLFLLLLMVGGIIPYILLVWSIVYSVIRLAKYLRKRVEMKEEFVDRLKGN